MNKDFNSKLIFVALILMLLPACAGWVTDNGDEAVPNTQESSELRSSQVITYEKEKVFDEQRRFMVENDIKARGVSDTKVINAMLDVKRHLFVDINLRSAAYSDNPLPIDEGQTISQPYIVAFMTEALNILPDEKVLEIGTGSGYQAAVLAELTDKVYSVEIKSNLSAKARLNLDANSCSGVQTKCDDGYYGWEEYAPFDVIIVTCAANHIPPSLIKQLKDGGRLIIPLGNTLYYQTLTLIVKHGEELEVNHILDVVFVPMTGEIEMQQQK